jgi:hypothetical protein
MQTRMLAALFGGVLWVSGVLWAQTPPAVSFEPAPQPATPGQASNSAPWERKQEPSPRFLWPSNRRLFSPPTFLPPNSTNGKPYDNGGQELLAIAPSQRGLVTIAPGGECAIPLVNVEPGSGYKVDPRMVIPVTQQLSDIDHMPVVQGLPSCTPAGNK